MRLINKSGNYYQIKSVAANLKLISNAFGEA